eukprot:CAMPEP_0206280614 /NCGR_PEP_ID=MMETSP0047_2-20121206/38676_1 /ASSEMBLY_ACC=CAM_ASM_000192 /TAXON_ID=195065 /ORGANISM="Chroomonas mesostigmatica_cf, Strain CCMP1168" /LENGTH=152 /DNA_ID=CAMNT_0053710695 /DNA_START=45 /DNA_END=504 /DNA_ORIENTATION=-
MTEAQAHWISMTCVDLSTSAISRMRLFFLKPLVPMMVCHKVAQPLCRQPLARDVVALAHVDELRDRPRTPDLGLDSGVPDAHLTDAARHARLKLRALRVREASTRRHLRVEQPDEGADDSCCSDASLNVITIHAERPQRACRLRGRREVRAA